MANLSDAKGLVTIKASSKESCERILGILESSLGKGDYGTYFDKSSIDVYDEGECFSLDCAFDACGRWSYASNIENSPQIIRHHASEEDIVFLELITWKIIYDYRDFEPGCELLGNFVYSLEHKAGAKLESTEFIEGGECTSYSCSWFNIMQVMEYSIDDLLDDRGLFYDDVVDDQDALECFEDEFFDFISDCSCEWGMSKEDVRTKFSKESEDFSKLYDLIVLGRKRKQD